MQVKGISADIDVIRSARKTAQLRISEEGKVEMRVPLHFPYAQIVQFLEQNAETIEKRLREIRAHRKEMEQYPSFSMREIQEMADRALKWIPERVAYYAKRMGVTFGRITIRNQKTRWGSCAETGNLNFNCLLMEMPENVRDSVIIHELAHRRHMNHSADFYAEVYRQMPKEEYDRCHAYLKKEGAILMNRMLHMQN